MLLLLLCCYAGAGAGAHGGGPARLGVAGVVEEAGEVVAQGVHRHAPPGVCVCARASW